jgi:hypothetical protein
MSVAADGDAAFIADAWMRPARMRRAPATNGINIKHVSPATIDILVKILANR